jgi:hypothetical protein
VTLIFQQTAKIVLLLRYCSIAPALLPTALQDISIIMMELANLAQLYVKYATIPKLANLASLLMLLTLMETVRIHALINTWK